jgi:PPE-repeat protein
VPILLSLSSLHSLRLSKNYLGDGPVSALAPVLQTHSTLQLLDLSANGIGDSGAVSIANLLSGSASITNLDLSNNCIGDVGAAAIEECLQSNHSLVQLELLGNPISAAAASGIGQALRVNRTITRSYSSDSEGGGFLMLRAVKEREVVIGLSDEVMALQRAQLAAADAEISALHEQLRAQEKVHDRDLKVALEDAKRQREIVLELEGKLAQQGCRCCMM